MSEICAEPYGSISFQPLQSENPSKRRWHQTDHQGPEKSLSDEGVHELGVKLQKGEEDRIPEVKDKMS